MDGIWNIFFERRQMVLLYLSLFRQKACVISSKSSALSCQVAQEMVFSVNNVLFSAQPRANGKMHIWLVNHNQAWVPRSFFIEWLSFVLYTFSVWIMWRPDGNLQWPLNSHLGGPLNPLWNVMFATWSALSVVPKRKIIHLYLFIYLFFLFRNWPLVTGVQSEECCGFLAVNIWPRTERTCCRSKVRDLTFCHHWYFGTLFCICAFTHGLLFHNWRGLSNNSSKSEIQCECHKVCY